MIGQIELTVDNGIVTVCTMNDDYTWSVPTDTEIEAFLNLGYKGKDDYSPADGEPGIKKLYDVAKLFNGKVTYTRPLPKREYDPSIIY